MRTRNIAGVVATALIFGSAAVLADEHEHGKRKPARQSQLPNLVRP